MDGTNRVGPFERANRIGMKGPHDMGGDEAGPVDPHDHAQLFWEQRADAIRALTVQVCSTDELRRAREQLGSDYHTMTYHERAIASIAQVFIERGVISIADLTRKLAEIEAREAR